MSEHHHLLLATTDPQEGIGLMLDAAATRIDPEEGPLRRGFQIALDAVSTPSPQGPLARAGDAHALVELLLAAAVANIAQQDIATLAGMEVALDAVLSVDEQPAATVLAERFAATGH